MLDNLHANISPDVRTIGAIAVALLTINGMVCVGLYNREHFISYQDVVSRLMVIIPMMTVFFLLCLFLWGNLAQHDLRSGNYLFCLLTLAAFFPAALLWRAGFLQLIDRTETLKRRVLILGSGRRADKIARLSRQHRDRTITIVGYVHLGSPPAERLPCQDGKRRDYWVQPADLAAFCRDRKVDELVIATVDRRGLPVDDLLACKFQGIRITEYASFWERECGQVDLDEISPSWMLFSDGFQISLLRKIVKRLTDIIFSLLVLLLTLPVTLLTALLIKLESAGPLFYRQERVGLDGKPFMVLKFRSMRIDAEKDGPRWAASNDTRVTKVGAFIRKVRIDEIPQVINVLKGDMAFVGPRPERPVFVSALSESIRYYSKRHIAKPGITGWAQINYSYGATEEDAKIKLSYDLYYIKNYSLFLDIITMMQTLKVLIWNSGAR